MANEKRLIDANALTDVIENTDWYHIGVNGKLSDGANPEHNIPLFKADDIYEALENAPTVDAVEVVHGRWENIRNFGGGECYGWCSRCKTPVKADNATGLVQSNRFCHWCGATMGGEARNEARNEAKSEA